MSNRLPTITSLVLVTAIVGLVMGSWIASSMGGEVHNALSIEGLRWLFVHAIDDPYHLLPSALLCFLLAGLLRHTPRAPLVLFFTAALMLIFLFFPPLRGLTGHLVPSPFLRGLVPVFCFLGSVLSLLGSWLSGRVALSDTFRYLARSLSPYLPWFVVILMLLFFVNLIQFVIV